MVQIRSHTSLPSSLHVWSFLKPQQISPTRTSPRTWFGSRRRRSGSHGKEALHTVALSLSHHLQASDTSFDACYWWFPVHMALKHSRHTMESSTLTSSLSVWHVVSFRMTGSGVPAW